MGADRPRAAPAGYLMDWPHAWWRQMTGLPRRRGHRQITQARIARTTRRKS